MDGVGGRRRDTRTHKHMERERELGREEGEGVREWREERKSEFISSHEGASKYVTPQEGKVAVGEENLRRER